MTRLEPSSLDGLSQDLFIGLFYLAPKGELPLPIHTGVWLQSYLGLTIRSTHWWGKHRLSAEEAFCIILLQPGPQCLDLWALTGLHLGFRGHQDH